MADYLTGDQGSVAALTGGGVTVTDICRWAIQNIRPKQNTTPFGSGYTRWKMTRPTATGFFDVMLLDSNTAMPIIPDNAQVTAQFRNSTSPQTTGYDLTLRIESQQILVDNITAAPQIIRYTWWADSVVTPV